MNSSKCWLDESLWPDAPRKWYATVHCVVHGWVDEEIAWDEAKTPFKACQLARERHYRCGNPEERQAEQAREFALAQINAAGAQLLDYTHRLEHARQALDDGIQNGSAEKVAACAHRLACAERDLGHAQRRFDEVADNNAFALPIDLAALKQD